MRKNKIFVLITTSIIFTASILSVAASTIKNQVTKNSVNIQKQIISGTPKQWLFTAQISFTLYEGTGCGCSPIPDAQITAFGLDVDHNDSGITDDDGICILELEINGNYRVEIQAENYQIILFDFLVIDDQNFVFHMQEDEGSSNAVSTVSNNMGQIIEISN
ncbi:MAG: hypothetical protein QHH19_01730 [Candidatus Thermoplasmatota archaeon]|jgi:hypothetical protein|nr:hypothetical protein [Candidatus Thermoplasmatota archaeon]